MFCFSPFFILPVFVYGYKEEKLLYVVMNIEKSAVIEVGGDGQGLGAQVLERKEN